MAVARVQARGQVTVPQEIREACGITPGSDLVFIPCGVGQFICRVLPEPRPLAEVLERFTVDGSAPDVAELMDAMASEIAERFGR